MRRIIVVAICVALPLSVLSLVQAQTPPDPGQDGPYAVTRVTITTTNPDTGSELTADIHYPSCDGNVDPDGAPYTTLVFAHGLQASRSNHFGNGQHLASWGYIVAIPDFPDNDIEVRASDTQYLFSYLETENGNESSRFFQKIDTDHLGMTGHSLGGLSTLMIAARDDRINLAAVPLDPVNTPGDLGVGTWDCEGEAPNITAPIGLIGAPPHTCNWDAQYNEMIPFIGATHKAKFVIVGGNHCDFVDGEDPLEQQICALLCGVEFSPERLELIERYTAAWFNYYLRLDTDFYAYLYGDEAEADIQAGLITREMHTAPRDVSAEGQAGAVALNWTLYDHPIIAGYNIYRSQQSGDYPGTPHAQVGRESSYVDRDVVPGQRYFYVLRSRDAAGNEHQPSDEVSAVPRGITPVLLSPPNGTVTTSQAITFAWTAGAGTSPEGYNLKLDETVITTTGTTSATILSLGVHTWTVRAYDATGYSDWTTPAWTVEITETLPPPGVPTLLAPPDGAITTTQAVTFAWQAAPGGTPAGYNLQVDSNTITTTNVTSSTILPVGTHTWTVRAYNTAGVSQWAVPWKIEVRGYIIYLPLVMKLS